MIAKLLPVLLALAGLGLGGGAGWYLRPAAKPEQDHAATDTAEGDHAAPEEGAAAHPAEAESESEGEGAPEYVKLNNQFVIPVMQGGKVAAMVVLALSLEVSPGSTEAVYAREPKLRDQFLQVLFDHANTGGFAGSFTDASNLILLRKALLGAAKDVLGPELVREALISAIAHQDG